jgi:hypothetical protein
MCHHLHRLIAHNRILGHVVTSFAQKALGELAAGIVVNSAGITNRQYPTTNPLDLGICKGTVTDMTHGAILSWYDFSCKMPDSSASI